MGFTGSVQADSITLIFLFMAIFRDPREMLETLNLIYRQSPIVDANPVAWLSPARKSFQCQPVRHGCKFIACTNFTGPKTLLENLSD